MSFIPRLPSLLIALAALGRPLCAEGEVPEGFAVEADGSLLVLVRRTKVHDEQFRPPRRPTAPHPLLREVGRGVNECVR